MIRIFIAILFLWVSYVQAEDLDNLQIHGFLSQGYILTDKNDFFGDSNGNGSFDFRELGLNASLRPISNLQLSAQILSRRAGKGNKGGIRVDYGFADYRIFSDISKQFGIRLGRTKNPFGFYNDTRDVPFTRPSILLPQSIYFDRTRNLALAADGAQLYGETSTGIGNFSVELQAGLPQVKGNETEAAVFRRTQPGDMTAKMSYIGRVIYERDGGRWRLALSGASVNVGYDPAAKPPTDSLSGSVSFAPMIVSAQYNAERWSITSEYALRFFRIKDFGVSQLNQKFTGESFYFQGVYRFNPEWEAVLRYDVLFTDRKDRDGSEFAAARNGMPAHSRFAKDITVGLRWNVTPEFMLRTEYHYVNGTAWLSTLDNPNTSDTSQHWSLFAVQASYRF